MSRVLLLCIVALMLALSTACDDDDDDAPASTETPLPVAAITISQPARGATVDAPVAMNGTANVFEGVLHIDALNDSDGALLCRRRVMAPSGTGMLAEWTGVLAFQPPDVDSPITLRAYSFSAKDGSLINLVERPVRLSAAVPNIVMTSPGCGEEVSGSTLTVEGVAEVFEAALTVEIQDEFGNAPLLQNVLAASGSESSPWSATFDISSLPPGFYDVVAYSISAMNGSIINAFPVQISKVP